MKIDVFAHILPERFLKEYRRRVPEIENVYEVKVLPVTNLQVRMKLMDRYPDVLQILTVSRVPLEKYAKPKDAVELASIANDELAEIVSYHPDKFFAAVACLPMNDVDASLEEIDRAIQKLGLKGIQLYSTINGEPLDLPKFRPIFKKMSEYDLPVWIHPTFGPVEERDYGVFGWPFETSNALLRLITSGIFVEFPNLKFVVHHAGAMVSFFAERIKWILGNFPQSYPNLHEHFRRLYVDTALYGHTPGLMCAYEYFGADHMVFGTDFPLGPRWGMVEDTIASVERMQISEADKEKIFRKNIQNLLKLPL